MSLDVYLQRPGVKNYLETIQRLARKPEAGVSDTFQRISSLCEEALSLESIFNQETDVLFSQNITHNLNAMAGEAGIYEALWRPDEHGLTKAKQLVPLLEQGLHLLKSEPARMLRYQPTNGWGRYQDFVPWVERYLEACREHPEADVRVSR